MWLGLVRCYMVAGCTCSGRTGEYEGSSDKVGKRVYCFVLGQEQEEGSTLHWSVIYIFFIVVAY